MKTRIISGIIGFIFLTAVVWCGQFVLGIAIFVISLIAMYEFYRSVENAGFKPVKGIGYLSCLPILLMGFDGQIRIIEKYIDPFKSINYFSMGLFLVILVLFAFIIFLNKRYNIIDISITAFGALYVSFLFSFIVLTRNLEGGFFFMWLIFIGAWATDTFAYFSGVLFGKRKLLPSVSPKKTVEGSIGGILGCISITVLYGVFLVNNNYVSGMYLKDFIAIGIMNAIISQIGDLAASSIKRHVNVKDYGNLIPGHGGILDRFDSILFIAPVVYFYISFIVL